MPADSAVWAGQLRRWSAERAAISTPWAGWSGSLSPPSSVAGRRRLIFELELVKALAGVGGLHYGEGLRARLGGWLLGSL